MSLLTQVMYSEKKKKPTIDFKYQLGEMQNFDLDNSPAELQFEKLSTSIFLIKII